MQDIKRTQERVEMHPGVQAIKTRSRGEYADHMAQVLQQEKKKEKKVMEGILEIKRDSEHIPSFKK